MEPPVTPYMTPNKYSTTQNYKPPSKQKRDIQDDVKVTKQHRYVDKAVLYQIIRHNELVIEKVKYFLQLFLIILLDTLFLLKIKAVPSFIFVSRRSFHQKPTLPPGKKKKPEKKKQSLSYRNDMNFTVNESQIN